LHIAVGRDPTSEMIISFATKWSDPGVEAPLAGVHIGLNPYDLDRFVVEQEFPTTYNTINLNHGQYFAPYQHHITVDNLQPNTTYYYVAVAEARAKGVSYLRDRPLRDHPSQHAENTIAETKVISEEELNDQEEDHDRLRLLSPQPYDGSEKPCTEPHKVRSFQTAPETNNGPVTFAIIGDLGQFDHSQETLEHMKLHQDAFDAVLLVGDIAYVDMDHRRWDTFFDFLDDYSVFDEKPLMICPGNHGEYSL
jgi:hypothetical protein